MVEYAIPEPDAIAALQSNLLVIGDGFPLENLAWRSHVSADPVADLGEIWSAVLIDAAAISPEIAHALQGRRGQDMAVIVVHDGEHADEVGLLLDTRLTIIDGPVDAATLATALEDATLGSNLGEASQFAADDRIDALRRDAERIAAAISELAESRPPEAVRPITAERIRAHLRARRLRDRFFPAELFADPAWDMLLDLGAARLEGRKVSVSSLCIAAAVPTTTALRWVKALVDRGLFSRESDPDDARRAFIYLTPETSNGLDACLDAVLNQPGQ